jgi:hypothetical protein
MLSNREYEGFERRNYIRIVYTGDSRAALTLAGRRFDVIDISEGGIRFANPDSVRLQGRVSGRLSLLSGKSIDIEGRIEWVQDKQVGIFLRHRIPSELIQAERRHTIIKGD